MNIDFVVSIIVMIIVVIFTNLSSHLINWIDYKQKSDIGVL